MVVNSEQKFGALIGFIGLGVMGEPMAQNLMRCGYHILVHNRSNEAVERLVELGAARADTPHDVAAQSQTVVTMLPDTPDVETVYFGSRGLFESCQPGTLLIDMTTANAEIARRIYDRARAMGAESLDAPVSGGDVGAREASLSIMVGGDPDTFERALPIFQAMGKNIVYIGSAGAGQVTKACNQIVVGVTIEAIGEALALGKRAGIDLWQLREALMGGLARSRVLDLLGQRAIEERYDPGFRIRLHQKDLGIGLSIAADYGLSLPGAELVYSMMETLVTEGHGTMDHSYLIRHGISAIPQHQREEA